MNYQTPKGTRDFLPADMAIREKLIETIKSFYRLYGFRPWDGPAFENLETLTVKSGEAVKDEIYSFRDKSDRELGLRFELTGSLARIISSNSNLKKPLKLYNIGKAWRYERPQSGRFREFIQSDTDVFGSSSANAEAELLDMAVAILNKLGIKNYQILINSRRILDIMMRNAGITKDKIPDAFRALDKLNKIGFDGVKEEFQERGIDPKMLDSLQEYFAFEGTNEQKLDKIKEIAPENEKAEIDFLAKVVSKTAKLINPDLIRVDFSLVRGLDYYTSTVFEIRSTDAEDVGSFAGGGRYDDLVALYGGQPTPAVGISLGIERIFEILKRQGDLEMEPFAKVMVCYLEGMTEKAVDITKKIRFEGIRAIFDLNEKNLTKQLEYANDEKIPYCLIIFSDEEMKIKDMAKNEEKQCTLEEASELLR